MPYTDEQLYALRGDFQTSRIVAGVRHGLAHIVNESANNQSGSLQGEITTDRHALDNIEMRLDNFNRPVGLVSMVAFLRQGVQIHLRGDMNYHVSFPRAPYEEHLAQYTTPQAFGRAYFWLAVHVLPQIASANGGVVAFAGHATSEDRRATSLRFRDDVDLVSLVHLEQEITGVFDASAFIVIDPIGRTIKISVVDEPRRTQTSASTPT